MDVTLVIDGDAAQPRVRCSYQAAIDEVVDKVERQAIDYKEKPRVRSRPEEEKELLRRIADGTAEGGTERQIVKTKRFAIEPMFEEDAAAAMDELGHDFYVFVNAENEAWRSSTGARTANFGRSSRWWAATTRPTASRARRTASTSIGSGRPGAGGARPSGLDCPPTARLVAGLTARPVAALTARLVAGATCPEPARPRARSRCRAPCVG